MKVICAGSIKTGTKSMREALEILGYENVHDVCEQIMKDREIIEKAVLKSTATIEDIKKAYHNVDSLTDIPGCFMWRELMQAFPHAKVVLTVRDSPEQWYQSLRNLIRETTGPDQPVMSSLLRHRFCPTIFFTSKLQRMTHKYFSGSETFQDFTRKDCISRYTKHNQAVKDFCHQDRLLVYNVKDGWEPLCKFLGKDIPNVPFPRRNVNHTLRNEILFGRLKYDGGFCRAVYKEMIQIFTFLLILLVLIIYIFVMKVSSFAI